VPSKGVRIVSRLDREHHRLGRQRPLGRQYRRHAYGNETSALLQIERSRPQVIPCSVSRLPARRSSRAWDLGSHSGSQTSSDVFFSCVSIALEEDGAIPWRRAPGDCHQLQPQTAFGGPSNLRCLKISLIELTKIFDFRTMFKSNKPIQFRGAGHQPHDHLKKDRKPLAPCFFPKLRHILGIST